MSEKSYYTDYRNSIHKVQDYIDRHLSASISLQDLSNAAGFSTFHFSRIFHSLLQETPAHYVNRIRMERALFLLTHRKDKNMTEIAFDLGLADSSSFSRIFKNYYGISPYHYRKKNSKNCKEFYLLSSYNKATATNNDSIPPTEQPLICRLAYETIPAMKLVYVRHTGTYETLAEAYPTLIHDLFSHATAQNLFSDDSSWVLAMYHDNPEFGDASQFRTSLCISIPEQKSVQCDDLLGVMTLDGGLYAVGHFTIYQEQYSDAWDHMYREWITKIDFKPRDSIPFEVYRHIPSKGENARHKVDIYVPVESNRL